MSTVLLQEDALRTEAKDSSTIPVPVTVTVVNGQASFVEAKADNYVITSDGISLVGSGGTPRELRLTFTLSPEAREKGYQFANPALKFFQGGSKKAGFRVSPDAAGTVTLSTFNILGMGDHPVQDDFSILLDSPKGPISHDPTILWEPPKS
ncbi:MAG TPA: hypothetical protein VJ885_03775 [Thermoanaerobaculia bacterium]|nr:hypothetical protein [Thermoanaerobaculia bacterium]